MRHCSRRSVNRFGCPAAFLIRTRRERSIKHSFARWLSMRNTLKAPDSNVPSISSCQNCSDSARKNCSDSVRFLEQNSRFWHDAIDGTLLSGAFRMLCIDNHLAKLCFIDRSRRVRIKNATGCPNRFTGRRERCLTFKCKSQHLNVKSYN